MNRTREKGLHFLFECDILKLTEICRLSLSFLAIHGLLYAFGE